MLLQTFQRYRGFRIHPLNHNLYSIYKINVCVFVLLSNLQFLICTEMPHTYVLKPGGIYWLFYKYLCSYITSFFQPPAIIYHYTNLHFLLALGHIIIMTCEEQTTQPCINATTVFPICESRITLGTPLDIGVWV